MDIRMQPDYQQFYNSQYGLPEPISADDEVDLSKLKRPIGFAHLAGTQLKLTDEGRRRQSSNFFDILTDPQKYQEQVKNFVNENC